MDNGIEQATGKQCRYIEDLAKRLSVTLAVRPEDMTKTEASLLLESFQERESKIAKETTPKTNGNNDRNKDIKLGLAFKLVYQKWIHKNQNVHENTVIFKDEVIQTYNLIASIGGD